MEFKYRHGEQKDPADLCRSGGEAWRPVHVTHQPLAGGMGLGDRMPVMAPLQWELGNGRLLQMMQRTEMEERIRREVKEQIREEILEQQRREYAELRRVLEEEVRREMDLEQRQGGLPPQGSSFQRTLEKEQRIISPLLAVDEGDQSSCLINPVDVIGNELALVDSLNGFADREGNSGMDQVTLLEQPPILGHFPDEHDSPIEDSPMVVVGNELALIPCNKPSMEAKMFDHINPGSKRYGQAIVESSIKKARASDESWRCAVCEVTTTSEEDLNFHLQGKEHKTSAEKLNMKPTLIMKSDESESSASKLGNGKGTLYMPSAILLQARGGERSPLKVEVASQKASKKKGSSVTTVWCEPCKAMCNSADVMEAHLNGKRHKAQMKKLNNGEDGAK